MVIRPLSNPSYPYVGGQLTFNLQEKGSCGLDVQPHSHVLQNKPVVQGSSCLGQAYNFTLLNAISLLGVVQGPYGQPLDLQTCVQPLVPQGSITSIWYPEPLVQPLNQQCRTWIFWVAIEYVGVAIIPFILNSNERLLNTHIKYSRSLEQQSALFVNKCSQNVNLKLKTL